MRRSCEVTLPLVYGYATANQSTTGKCAAARMAVGEVSSPNG
jgi:hypothetical protein